MHILGILGFTLRQEESLGKFKLLEIKAKFKADLGGEGICLPEWTEALQWLISHMLWFKFVLFDTVDPLWLPFKGWFLFSLPSFRPSLFLSILFFTIHIFQTWLDFSWLNLNINFILISRYPQVIIQMRTSLVSSSF